MVALARPTPLATPVPSRPIPSAGHDVRTQYVWSPVYVDAMVLRDRDTDPNSAGLEERLYVTHDANFNITSIIGHSGTDWEVVERYLYDPYGARTVLDANWAADADGISDVAFIHGHQGGRHDLAVGSIHFRFRDLLRLGVWNRQDPAGYVDGASLHFYATSSPITNRDASGLTTQSHHDPGVDGGVGGSYGGGGKPVPPGSGEIKDGDIKNRIAGGGHVRTFGVEDIWVYDGIQREWLWLSAWDATPSNIDIDAIAFPDRNEILKIPNACNVNIRACIHDGSPHLYDYFSYSAGLWGFFYGLEWMLPHEFDPNMPLPPKHGG